jgi:hypothetical protein
MLMTFISFSYLIALADESTQALVAHACNPSYSGGSDQEDHGSNSSQDPILKKSQHKNRVGGVA